MTRKLPKRLMSILESMFAHEIAMAFREGQPYPFQSRKKKVMAELEVMQFVVPTEQNQGGRFPLIVRGWQLTHLGRMTFCASCKEEPEWEKS